MNEMSSLDRQGPAKQMSLKLQQLKYTHVSSTKLRHGGIYFGSVKIYESCFTILNGPKTTPLV